MKPSFGIIGSDNSREEIPWGADNFSLILAEETELTDQLVDDLCKAGCDAGSLSSRAGNVTVTFHREAESLEQAIRSGIVDVQRAGCHAARVEIETDDLAEIGSGQFGQAVEGVLGEDPGAQPADVKPLPKTNGLLVIYTGDGKGKTTAALGMMTRCLGRGYPVGVVQFIKGKWKTGEGMFAESFPNLTFHTMGRGFTWESKDLDKDRQSAAGAWEKAKEMIDSGKFFVVILDEITYAINYHFIELADVLVALKNRPAGVHVVLTGRDAPPELVEVADMVSEMRKIKHPFDKGIKAQMGVDF